jgi:predicted DNA-binding mobile mystery protein A
MNAKLKQAARQQLDKTLRPFSPLKDAPRPVKGWIKAVREAIGMSGRQMADQLGVSGPRITKLEQDELAGAVTLKSMKQAAEALDCVFVYALVPRTSLEESVRSQARKVVRSQMKRASHTMLLEAQSLSDDEARASVENAVDSMVREMPRDLWEKKP